MTSPTTIAHPSGISRTIFAVAIIIVAVISGVSGYYVGGYFNKTSVANFTLNGTGATFPYPFISAVSTNYSRTHLGIAINYQSLGSGAGVRALTAKTVDFAASDAPLSDAERTAAPNALHIPETVGSVVFAYNLPGISKGLNLTGDLIAKIFLGQITKWNDSSIKTLNQATLPNQPIQVVHRSDGSGTTFVWTSYLSLVSPTWNSTVGYGKSVPWPIGLGASGNEGVAGVVKGTTFTAGYVELAYALTNSMSYAYIQNAVGTKFIQPSIASTAAAFNTVTSFPTGDASWKQVTLLNSSDPNAYPIASLTYILVYKELNVVPGMTLDKAKALTDFLWFMVHDGQNQANPLGYVTLSAGLTATDETSIRSITFGGTAIHP
jgi:phosphate transport system substrate-binding protein